jgi:hypothetical protein
MRRLWLFATVLLGGCSGIPQSQRVSDCGGFAATPDAALAAADQAGSPDYCAAERLVWTYDAGRETLVVENTRVLLNCCGEHSITIDSLESGRYLIEESDAPEGGLFGSGRCDCMCVYDFRVTAEEIPARTLTVRLKRDVTDDDEAVRTVWRGELPLAQGAGSIEVDSNDIGPWCDPM